MAELQDRALLVRRIPYGDSSLICHFFSEHHGRIALMARGARRPKSPFRATLEPLYELQIGWRTGRTGMGTLTDASRGPSLLPTPLMLDGQELIAIASRLFHEGDLHGFDELISALARLSLGGRHALLPAVWLLFEQTGWLGDIEHCWRCGAEAEASMFWSAGELLCGSCGKGMEISAGLRKSVAALMGGERVMLSDSNAEVWREMIRQLFRQHGIRPTESFRG